MRVLTQNLLGRLREWPHRRPVLDAGLRQLAPDIVMLQEAIVTVDDDQAAELLGPDFHLAHQTDRAADGSGISIASTWPLGEVRELDLRLGDGSEDFPAGALAVDVHWPVSETPLLAVDHKPFYQPGAEDERRSQAEATASLVDRIVADTGQTVLLGGDFDAESEAPSVRYWEAAYRDAWRECNGADPGPTFAPSLNALVEGHWKPGGDRRIDYLFTRTGDAGPDLAAQRCERAFTTPVRGVWASDHFGVWAEFAVRDR
ncbi:endonuclease/exonuclease/phosphatase family protein [Glycomyces tarimensis]